MVGIEKQNEKPSHYSKLLYYIKVFDFLTVYLEKNEASSI